MFLHRTITRGYWRGADGVVVVFSTTQRETFGSVNKWVEEMNDFELGDSGKLLVGTKTDLVKERVISTEEGQALGKSLGISCAFFFLFFIRSIES